MRSNLASFFAKNNARPVQPDIPALKSGEGEPRVVMGLKDFPSDQPVAYVLFFDNDKAQRRLQTMNPERWTEDDLTPACAFSALAFTVASRRVFDAALARIGQAFHRDADRACVGDLTMKVTFLPALKMQVPGADFRELLPADFLFAPALKCQSAPPRPHDPKDPRHLSRVTPLRQDVLRLRALDYLRGRQP